MLIAGKYKIIGFVGGGWEGEVYHLKELATGIERAGKFFFPHRNKNNKTLNLYAKKLHKLRDCPILIQYHTQDVLKVRKEEINFLISEYVEGIPLGPFIAKQPGKKLNEFQALHLLYSLSKGLEDMHQKRQYHGDLHLDNILIRRFGLSFDLKVLDFFHWSAPNPDRIKEDVIDMIRVFYDALGGKKNYSKLSKPVKSIICGLKRSQISKKFSNARKLRLYLENLEFL